MGWWVRRRSRNHRCNPLLLIKYLCDFCLLFQKFHYYLSRKVFFFLFQIFWSQYTHNILSPYMVWQLLYMDSVYCEYIVSISADILSIYRPSILWVYCWYIWNILTIYRASILWVYSLHILNILTINLQYIGSLYCTLSPVWSTQASHRPW